MRRGDVPRMEMRSRHGWMGSLGRARSALATATRNLGEMVGSDDPEVEAAVERALTLIEGADEALVDALSGASWKPDSDIDERGLVRG